MTKNIVLLITKIIIEIQNESNYCKKKSHI